MVMDRTLKDYLNLSEAQAVDTVKTIVENVKAVGGQFTLLWHNDALSNSGEWEGWHEVFEDIVAHAETKITLN
jgi:hypothetical protein